MPNLSPLNTSHGYFSENKLEVSGYVAQIPAWQKIYFADGRNYDEHGYHKLDFLNTKITADATAAFNIGELVTQATSGAKGYYGECTDIILTSSSTFNDFTLGELVTQDTSGAKGYVAFSDGANKKLYVHPITYTLSTPKEFSASYEITGETSEETMTPDGSVTDWYDYNVPPTTSTGAVGRFHFIYRITTTEFDTTNIITGADSGSTITPETPVSEVQTLTPNSTATGGTYTITYDGQTTAAIDHDASTDDIDAALLALSNVNTSDITAGGTIFSDGTGGLTLTFADDLGDVPSVTVTSSMTGATSVTVAETTKGVAAVLAPPHWLPWIPVAGVMPDGGSNIGCACFSRIFLNSMVNPHHWYCSRAVANFGPLDFDTSQTDTAAATYSQSAKAHEVGDVLVAMIPYKDHSLIWGCANEIWLLQSDPLMGGVNRCISKTTGIFSPTSYCWDDENNLQWVGSDGVYKLTSEAILSSLPPKNITKARLPKLISNLALNRRTDRVVMGYDKKRYGIEVSISMMDGSWNASFWLDLRTGGLFPDVFATNQEAHAMFYYDAYNSSERELLLAGGGYIRKFDESEKSDDGDNAIESHFFLGPIVADGEPRHTVDMSEMSLTLGEDSDGVTVSAWRAKSADELINNIFDDATPEFSKTLSGDGLKDNIIEKVSGRAVALKVENTTADEGFSMEEINLNVKVNGKEK